MKYLIVFCLLMSACLKVKPKDQDQNQNQQEKKSEISNQNITYDSQEYVVQGEDIIHDENHPLLTQRFKKIIWEPNAILTTNGFKLKLQFEEMTLTENNILQTFPEGLKAALNNRGRSGGDVEIRGQTVIGHLKIIMRGENGGDGSAAAVHSSLVAADGAPGKDVRFSINLLDDNPINCAKNKPTPGENGSNGLHGQTGQRGGAGGNAGVLFLEIKNNSDFVKEILSEPGIGGSGGLGGLGQKGGKGGRSGVAYRGLEKLGIKQPHIDQYYQFYNNEKMFKGCPAPVNGQNGTDGLPGSNGAPGDKGAELKQCFKKTDEEVVCY